jgi:hypothetical protein
MNNELTPFSPHFPYFPRGSPRSRPCSQARGKNRRGEAPPDRLGNTSTTLRRAGRDRRTADPFGPQRRSLGPEQVHHHRASDHASGPPEAVLAVWPSRRDNRRNLLRYQHLRCQTRLANAAVAIGQLARCLLPGPSGKGRSDRRAEAAGAGGDGREQPAAEPAAGQVERLDHLPSATRRSRSAHRPAGRRPGCCPRLDRRTGAAAGDKGGHHETPPMIRSRASG